MLELPDWCEELREIQIEAIGSIVEGFDLHDILILDAPTGSGKTLIGECVRQLLHANTIYLCSSLTLQDQFCRDYPHALLLRGRSNYPTLDLPSKFPGLSCADCNKEKIGDKWRCEWCSRVRDCPYEIAKREALASPLICTNTYYFLYEANYQGGLSGRSLVIVDEADTLESILMAFIEVSISSRTVKELDLPIPAKKTVTDSWVEWANTAHQLLGRKIRQSKHAHQGTLDLRRRRQLVRMERLSVDLQRLLDEDTGIASGGWVYTDYDRGNVVFKPIEVSQYAHDYLWRHGQRWLLMSATIISSQVLMKSLGVG